MRYELEFLANPMVRFNDHFVGCDSPEAFNINLTTMPNDWHYRNKHIVYTVNSFGYRTVEFDNIKWEDAIVVFGCSNVFGVGLAEDETLCHRLSLISGCPTINMGAGGTSMLFSLHNQLALNAIAKPKAVVNVWTGTDRITLFNSKGAINSSVHSNGHISKELFKIWNLDPTHPLKFSIILQSMARVLWKDIPNVEATFFESTATDLGCEFLEWSDKARDLTHPGYKTVDNAAKLIYSKL